MTLHFSARGKYVPLNQYLEAVPADQQAVTLTFAELEVLVGPLAPQPKRISPFWTSSTTAQMNWQRAGFTARLDRWRQAITFTRLS